MPKPTFLQSVLGRPSRSYAAERGAPTSPPTWDGPSPTRSSFSAGSVVAAPRRASIIPSSVQHQLPRSSTSDIGTSTYYPRRPSLQAYAEYDDYAEYAASGSGAPQPPQPHQPSRRPADAGYTPDSVRRCSQALSRSQSVATYSSSSRGLLSGDTLYDDVGLGGVPQARTVQIAIPRGGLDDDELGDDDDDDADGEDGYLYQDPAEYSSPPSSRSASYLRSHRDSELRPPKLTPPGSTTSSETPPSVSSTLYSAVSAYDPPYSAASDQQPAASRRKSSVDTPTTLRRRSLGAPPTKMLPAPPPAPKPRPKTVYYDFDSDSEADDGDAFFTPRTSLDVIDEYSEEDTPAAQILQLPVVQLQPPTPAPVADPGATPFHADDQPGSESEGYLSPDVDRRRAPFVGDAPDDKPEESESEEMASVVVAERVQLTPKAPTPAHVAPAVPTFLPAPKQQKQHRPPIQVPPLLPPKESPDRGGRVRHAHMTVLNEVPIKIERKSDSLTRSKSTKSVKAKSKSIRSASSSDYGPPELPRKTQSEDGRPALPSWVTEQPPPLPQSLSRASTSMSRPMSRPSTSMSNRTEPARHERRVSADSANTGSDVGRSVDGGVRTAGYGKGGWAAASAAPLVMYMPSGGDGWAAFQPLPPRSRYNPLPGAHGSSERGTDSRGGSSWSGSLGRGSAPTSVDGRGSSQQSRNSITSLRTPTNEDFGRRASVASALRASITPPGTPPLPAPTPAAADSDSESENEQPSRSYATNAKAAHPTPAAPPPRVPSEELVRGSLSFDYASEASHGDHNLPVHASPAKYDGAGRHRSWIAEGYDPYTDARAASSDLSRSNTMASARQSMPPLPRRAPESVNSAPSTISSRHSYIPPSAIHSPPLSDGGRTPRLPAIPRQLPLDPVLEGGLGPMSPDGGSLSPYDLAARAHAGRVGLDRPSSLNPDMLTFLPTMTEQDSNRLYAASEVGPPRRAKSVKSLVRYAMSDGGDAHTPRESLSRSASRRQSMSRPLSRASAYSDAPTIRKANSTGRIQLDSMFDNTNVGSAPLMESHGRDQRYNGYTNMVLPTGGAYKPSANPVNELGKLNARALGMPQSSMAAITFSSSLFNLEDKGAPTPAHLRGQLPPPVDFTSHSRPPTKVAASQVMVQVYAVAIDQLDIDALPDLKRSAVGKYIPGRSFVGRVQAVGDGEKDLVRGDIVVGLQDIRKSGALCEYILVERRRVGRIPPSTTASLEQLAALPMQGIACVRALRGVVKRNTRALIMDADTGIPALMCQEMARMGVSVVAIIPGGEGSGAAQAACMANGAKGVHIGSPAAVMLGLEEAVCDIVVDTRGGKKVTDAARRVLVNGGRVFSFVPPDEASSPETTTRALPPKRSKSLKNLRASFVGGRKKDHGHNLVFEYIHAAGAGEPEVDASGLDVRDVLEEPLLGLFRPAVETVVPFERGAAVFRPRVGVSAVAGGVAVVRLVN